MRNITSLSYVQIPFNYRIYSITFKNKIHIKTLSNTEYFYKMLNYSYFCQKKKKAITILDSFFRITHIRTLIEYAYIHSKFSRYSVNHLNFVHENKNHL